MHDDPEDLPSRLDELEEEHRLYRPERRVSLLLTWMGQWLRANRRVQVEALPQVEPGEVAVGHVGHASVLIRYAHLTIASDPMFASRVGGAPRAVLPAAAVADLDDVRLVLVGGAGPDRLCRHTLERLPRSATVVVPPGCISRLSGLGFARVVELGLGQSFAHRGVEVTSVPVCAPFARHSACAWMLHGPGPSIFLCGESGYFSGFADLGARARPDIALLPIGGYAPAGLRPGNMSPLDAVYAFEDLGARLLVPIRWGVFQLSYESLEDPIRWLRRIAAERRLERHINVIPIGGSRKYTAAG